MNTARLLTLVGVACKQTPFRFVMHQPRRSFYQTSDDRDLLKKQRKFTSVNSTVYMEKQEVPQHDGYTMIEPRLLAADHKAYELHLIKKIGSVKGEPWWVRQALSALGFDGRRSKEWKVVYSVQPNTVEINNRLWLCKHLVRLRPVTFKDGVRPDVNTDLANVHVNTETGVCTVRAPKATFNVADLTCFTVNGVTVTKDLAPGASFPLEKREIKRSLHRQKQLCRLNSEYFPATYDYKYDQDMPGVRQVPGRPDTSVKGDEINEDD